MIQPLRAIVLSVLAGIAFVAIDSVLAATEQRETAAEAERLSIEGKRLAAQGKYEAAIGKFRSAIANQRGNMEYPLELGRALRASGHLREAEAALEDLLKTNAMDGAANLAIARVFVKQDEFEAAAFYYHRAIYGQWNAEEATARRLTVRIELVDLLARRDRKAELLAELLPFEIEAPRDAATQEKLANLYLQAGSPARATVIFRDQARLHPGSPALRKGLNLAEQMLRLDPMRSELSEQERYQRSLRLLQLAVAKAEPCLSRPADSEDLPGRTPESNIQNARRLWNLVRTSCPSSISESDRPMELVLGVATK